MRDFISDEIKIIKPSGIRKYFDIVGTVKDAISLGVGEPDFVTPWNIREAGVSSIRRGYTQYTSNKGLTELRERIASYEKDRYGVNGCADEVIVTVGASEGIFLAIRAIMERGDEVLIPEPSYVSYSPCVVLSGGMPIGVPCLAKDDFKLTGVELEKAITPKTKALILPYPNNPTGAILEREYLEKIAEIVKKHDILVISDEIYAELTYGGKHVSIASLEGMKERTILISGFSKSFAMTGWRIGYTLASPEYTKQMLKIHQYIIMCAPSFSQYAAIDALATGAEDGYQTIAEMREEYDERRRFLVKAFNDMGLKCFEPRGAFYVFPSVRSLNMTGEEFAEKLLAAQKVAVVPGSAFGSGDCEYHIRCSYAYSMKSLLEAVERIRAFVLSL